METGGLHLNQKKKKESGAGAIVVLLLAAAKLIMKVGDSKISISLLYVLILAVLLFAGYRIYVRLSKNSGGKVPIGTLEQERTSKRAKPQGRSGGAAVKRVEREEERSAAACGENLSFCDAEQWKSLYESGLIDRDEYRERLNKTERRG